MWFKYALYSDTLFGRLPVSARRLQRHVRSCEALRDTHLGLQGTELSTGNHLKQLMSRCCRWGVLWVRPEGTTILSISEAFFYFREAYVNAFWLEGQKGRCAVIYIYDILLKLVLMSENVALTTFVLWYLWAIALTTFLSLQPYRPRACSPVYTTKIISSN